MPGDEDLRHRHQGVEERTDAEHDEQDLDDLAGDGLGAGCEPIGRDRVERPGKASQTPRSSVSASRSSRAAMTSAIDQREQAQAPQEGPDLGALAHQ